ncbi:TetR/AcrR family transcriptional regulator [Xanthocytophaga agilis]|uniref:TetR/AcrR family transcriptional regulator n=1 Tax=Xanthocytophaga agilis TaxID=3048010 RepID=A0AAE3RD79_9BACT|nr:TetR/AcrR family transcriptional regulator [Xanthocytophaga agilis]MDJ1506209.1 TetR/AcrR family transcriptional regulator [Xanthocytophaga agilis]
MDKKEIILQAAEELFAEKGFDATSVKDLSQRANVNVAMISYYFGSKEKLLETLIENKSNDLYTSLQNLNSQNKDPFAKLESLIDIYIERIFNNSNYFLITQRELFLKQRGGTHEAIMRIHAKNVEEIRKLLDEGQKQKLFRKVDTDLLMATISGTIFNVKKKEYFTQDTTLPLEETEAATNKVKKQVKKHLYEMLRAYLEIK